MGMFRQSLALDHVDRINTWAVLFLVLIALVAWLVPLSPLLASQATSHPGALDSSKIEYNDVHSQGNTDSTPFLRKYAAKCWCPAQFTQAHLDFTHAVCENTFNYIMQGGNASETPAKLYEMYDPDTAPRDPEDVRFRPEVLRKDQNEKEMAADKNERQDSFKDKEAKQNQQKQSLGEEEANRFFQVTTPFCVFLLAVCLMIPYLVWGLLTSLLGGINVDQTLVSAKEGSRLDHQSRRQLHTELAQAAVETAQSCPWKISCLYLLLKLLVCVAVLSEAIVVHNSLLPQARDAKQVFLQDNKNKNSIDSNASGASSSNPVTKTDKNEQSSNTYFAGKLLTCRYIVSIPAIVKEHDYEVQCVFTTVTPNPAPKTVTSEPDHLPQEVSPSPTGQIHMMYECLYLILLTLLVSLSVTNNVNLLVWITKLGCRPCQDSRTSRSQADLPLDGYFLLQMARENAGVDFVRVLAQGDHRRREKGEEGMELAE